MGAVRVCLLALIFGLVGAYDAPAQAQGWTDKTIRIVVTVTPGGPVDFVARLAAAGDREDSVLTRPDKMRHPAAIGVRHEAK